MDPPAPSRQLLLERVVADLEAMRAILRQLVLSDTFLHGVTRIHGVGALRALDQLATNVLDELIEQREHDARMAELAAQLRAAPPEDPPDEEAPC